MTRPIDRYRHADRSGWTGLAASLAVHAVVLGTLALVGVGLHAGSTPAPVPLVLAARADAPPVVLDPRPLVDTRVRAAPTPERPDPVLRSVQRPEPAEERPAFDVEDDVLLPDLVVEPPFAARGAVERAPGAARRRPGPSQLPAETGTADAAPSGAPTGPETDRRGPPAADAGPRGPTTGPRLPARLEQPAYPSRARRRGWEGRVVLELRVDARGRVTDVTVVRSSGYAVLDDAAIARATEWTLEPAQEDGAPVPGALRVPIRFQLR